MAEAKEKKRVAAEKKRKEEEAEAKAAAGEEVEEVKPKNTIGRAAGFAAFLNKGNDGGSAPAPKASPGPPKKKFCGECGAIAGAGKFCQECGKKL